jgi:hypothetical protein
MTVGGAAAGSDATAFAMSAEGVGRDRKNIAAAPTTATSATSAPATRSDLDALERIGNEPVPPQLALVPRGLDIATAASLAESFEDTSVDEPPVVDDRNEAAAGPI